MLRSLYAGVSGLNAHQTKMDVLANNIANVNTYGFKGSRVTFRDIYYQTTKNSGAGSDIQGGTNSSQIGYGASVGSIDKIMSRSSFQSTASTLDVAIASEGFFQVQDKVGNISYTRSGIFQVDNAGNVVDSTGKFVLGTMAGNVTNLGSLSPMAGNEKLRIKIPDAPTNGNLITNLNGTAITNIPVASNHSIDVTNAADLGKIKYKDTNGAEYTITLAFGAADGVTGFTAYVPAQPGPPVVPAVPGTMTLTLDNVPVTDLPGTTGDLQARLNTAFKTAKAAAAAGTPLADYDGGDIGVMTTGILSGSADLKVSFANGGADSAYKVNFAVAANATTPAGAVMSSDGLTMTITLPFGSKFPTLASLEAKANEVDNFLFHNT